MRWLSYWYLRLLGWTFHGSLPDTPKMVVIGAPHTSNFDFILFLGALHHFEMTVRYLGKHQLFKPPFGFIFRALGGIPVDRKKAAGVVGQVKRVFDESEEMILVVAPEGTRSNASVWKSGFVKIAEAADVPVVLAGVDGRNKTVTMGPALHVSNSFMNDVRDFYTAHHGVNPEKKGPVKLRGETPPS